MSASSSAALALREEFARFAEENRQQCFTRFGSEGAAWLALVPGWTFDLARQCRFPTLQQESLGRFLDRAVQANFCEATPEVPLVSCSLRIQPRSALAPSNTEPLQNRLRVAQEIGVARERAAEPFLQRNRPQQVNVENAAPDTSASPASTEPIDLRASEVVLRSAGLMFSSRAPLPAGLQATVTVQGSLKGTTREQIRLDAKVVHCEGNAFSGYRVSLVFEEDPAATELLARLLYHEFALSKLQRAEVIADLKRQTNTLPRTCADLGEAILGVAASVVAPPAVLRWATFAKQLRTGPGAAGDWLKNEVEGRLKEDRTGEALALLKSAEPLAWVFGGALESALRVSQRRLELSYRLSVDQRHLKDFLRRKEQITAFERLVNPASPAWAIHFLGLGGVGKTMLLRHINAELAGPRPVSRVDFDFLSPDYPVRRPGQLLIELADGLRLHAGERAAGLFQEFDSRTKELHERLSAEPPPNDPLYNIKRPEFDRMLVAFCDFVRLLPQPVILILDTCEELAKLQPDGVFQPSVAATFAILERAQQRLRSGTPRGEIRVVFAGRRLLAIEGHDWKSLPAGRMNVANAPAARGPRASAAVSAPSRAPVPVVRDERREHLAGRKDYLLLHPIRGFTRDEARRFLTEIKTPEDGRPPMDAAFEEAIAQRSLDDTTPANIEFASPDAARAEAAEDHRYNPFDLALYADWFIEDRSLDAATIASGHTDPYIEVRIVQRIKQENVKALLPHIVLLRRFERKLLARLTPLQDEAFENLFREFCNIEWIDYQPEESGTFLEVDRNLQPRLEKYFSGPERAVVFENAKRRLAAVLDPFVRETPLRELSFEYLSAALRLLPSALAADLWEQVNRRIATQADWHWAGAVCKRLFGEPGVVAPELRAAVGATQVAATLHTEPDTDVNAVWKEIEQEAAKHPDPAVADWLRERAFVGNIWNAEPSWETFWDRLPLAVPHSHPSKAKTFRAEQALAALCAAVERRLDLTESSARPWIDERGELARWAESLDGTAPAELRISALISAGRAVARRQRFDEAAKFFARALELIEKLGEFNPQAWLDWPMPANFVDRVRLEALRALPSNLRPRLGNLAEWKEAALGRVESIDGDRLVSCLLQGELASSSPERAAVQSLVWQGSPPLLFQGTREQPACPAHRAVSPLFVTLAQACLAIGDPAAGLLLLNTTLADAVLDDDSVRAAKYAKAAIIRRMRLTSTGQELVADLRASTAPRDLEVVLPILRLLGTGEAKELAPPAPQSSPRLVHAWWSCARATAAKEREALAATGTPLLQAALGSTSDEWEFSNVSLDRFEARLLAGTPGAAERAGGSFDQASQIRFALDPGARAVLALRRFALEDVPLPENLTGEVGARLVALMALQEGELLAFRLPERALPLLDLARTLAEAARDPTVELSAAVLGVIARVWAGQRQEATAQLQSAVAPAVKRLHQQDADFPSWPLPDGENKLQQLSHPQWGPWAARLHACKVFLESPEGRWTREGSWLAWAEMQFGPKRPLELDLTPTVHAPTASRWAPLVKVGYGVFGAVIGIGFWVFLYFPFASAFEAVVKKLGILQPATTPSISTFWKVVAYLVAIVALVLLIKSLVGVRTWLRSLLAAFSRFHLRIARETESSERDLDFSAVRPVTFFFRHVRWLRDGTLKGWLRMPFSPQEMNWQATGFTPGIVPLPLPGLRLPQPIEEELRTWAETLRKFGVPLPIETDPGFAGFGWEAVLLGAAAKPGPASGQWQIPVQLQPYRCLPVGRAARPLAARGLNTISLFCPPTWESEFHAAWKPAGMTVKTAKEPGTALAAGNLERGDVMWAALGGNTLVLHLVGTAFRGTAGLRLRVRSRGAGESNLGESISSGTPDVLISPELLPLAKLPLIIVQAEPVETLTRLQTDQEQAAWLRAFGSELLQGGAWHVLVLPALTPDLTNLVLGRIGLMARRANFPRLPSLLNTVSEVRELISLNVPALPAGASTPLAAAPGGLPAESSQDALARAHTELALEVCLFARDPRLEPQTPKPSSKGDRTHASA